MVLHRTVQNVQNGGTETDATDKTDWEKDQDAQENAMQTGGAPANAGSVQGVQNG